MKRPHIKQTMNEDGSWNSWCGVNVYSSQWAFQSLDHAILSEENLSTVGIPCTKCLRTARERIDKILRSHRCSLAILSCVEEQ